MSASTAIPRQVLLSPETHEQLLVELVRGRNSPDPVARDNARHARNTLAAAYRPWTSAQARKGAPAHAGDDREGQAQIQVLEALDRFDPSKGVPLSAYLISTRAVSGETVAQAGMPLQLGSRDQRRQGTASQPLSFETPVGEGLTLGGQIASTAAATDIEAEALALRSDIDEALAELPSQARWLVIARHGLDGGKPQTLAEIASSHGIDERTAGRRVQRAEAALAARLTHLRGGN